MQIKVKNLNVVTNEINFENHLLPTGNFNVNPQVSKRVGKVNNNQGRYLVEMMLEIKNKPEAPFPMDLTIRITGLFDCENVSDEEAIFAWLENQGAQMIYPHLCSQVSTITAIAMGMPLNISALFPFEIQEN